MRALALILQYGCFAFALFLSYQVATALYQQEYELLEIVADVGTILICIDLGVFLFSSKASQGLNLQEYARQLEAPPSKLVAVTNIWELCCFEYFEWIMRALALISTVLLLRFALFLSYQVATALYQHIHSSHRLILNRKHIPSVGH